MVRIIISYILINVLSENWSDSEVLLISSKDFGG